MSRQTLLRATFHTTCAALVVVALLPFARIDTALFGWLPLWLVGLPASAWLALRLAPVGHEEAASPRSAAVRRPRRLPQAVKAGRGRARSPGQRRAA